MIKGENPAQMEQLAEELIQDGIDIFIMHVEDRRMQLGEELHVLKAEAHVAGEVKHMVELIKAEVQLDNVYQFPYLLPEGVGVGLEAHCRIADELRREPQDNDNAQWAILGPLTLQKITSEGEASRYQLEFVRAGAEANQA